MDRERRLAELEWSCESRSEICARVADLEELAAELYPFVGDSCPEECRWRGECDPDGPDCVAYGEYFEILTGMGIEVGK